MTSDRPFSEVSVFEIFSDKIAPFVEVHCTKRDL